MCNVFCQIYPLERVVCGRALMGEFNSNEITNLLNLLDTDYFNLQVISPIFKKNGTSLTTDPIYGTEYMVEDLPLSQLQLWAQSSLNPNLRLPSPNEFIPQDFKLKPSTNTSDLPELVLSNDKLKVWHLQDSKYLLPKAFIGFFFKRFEFTLLPCRQKGHF